MVLTRRAAIGGALVAAGSSTMPRAQEPSAPAAPWPQRRVTIIVPFGIGGSTYDFGRLIARRLGRAFGQPFVVEPRSGRGGMAGTCEVAAAAPDGHTLLLSMSGAYAIAAQLDPCPVALLEGLAPIGLLATAPHLVVVPAGSGFRSLADLVAAARAAPGGVRYLTPYDHDLPVLFLADAMGLRLAPVLVPSGSAGDAVHSLGHGEAEFALIDTTAGVAPIRSGALRALAVVAEDRVAVLPDVPTIAEAGGPALRSGLDFALFAPAGTPEPVLERLSAAMRQIMASDETRDVLIPLGICPVAARREDFPAYLEAESRRWQGVIRGFGIGPR